MCLEQRKNTRHLGSVRGIRLPRPPLRLLLTPRLLHSGRLRHVLQGQNLLVLISGEDFVAVSSPNLWAQDHPDQLSVPPESCVTLPLP